MKSYLPKPEILVNLQPEEVGMYLLPYLIALEGQGVKLNTYNLLLESNQDLRDYIEQFPQNLQVVSVLSEAIQWLKNEGFIANRAADSPYGWIFITRKGKAIKTKADFKKLSYIKLLPFDQIDEQLKDKVMSSFIRGDFATSVFAAFKEVEIRLREGAKLDRTWYGVKLVDKAFDAKVGLLTDPELTDTEKARYHEMMRGTIGTFKNPLSHRDVNYDDPVVAVGLILFANSLIQTIETRAQDYSVKWQESVQAVRP